MNDNPFTWDGSDLTDWCNSCTIFTGKLNKLHWWKIIDNKDKIYLCFARTSSNGAIPCIIDELKPLFGLIKIGTHWVKLKGKTYILYRPQLVGKKKKFMLVEQTLTEWLSEKIDAAGGIKHFQYDPMLVMQVQEIFAFRELLGISRTFESSLIVRKGLCGPSVLSWYEPNMADHMKGNIPFTVLEKWFENYNTDLATIVKKITKITSRDKLTQRIQEIQKDAEAVIKRIDDYHIRFADYLKTRIIDRVQSTF